ncbi:MAG: BlaB/IND/MUS family subclass B1 metallo-beta-lactamase [Cyclobacteriaceae bacterium]|nr:BlaB/IND/MUS family subclass B1 metallo-beta-lactamase [Cyclobacteriaceae bacterium]
MKLRSILLIFFIASVSSHAQNMRIREIKPDFYVYTTYNYYNGALVPSNSMYVVTTEGVVMIDTPWKAEELLPLLDSIQRKHKQKVVLCISTHYHADRTAGLELLNLNGIKTYTSRMTWDLSGKYGEKQASHAFSNDTTFIVGNHAFQTYYPGEGHTKDNIVVWFGKERILYGGCFIKSTEATGLGNVADANIKAWPISMKNTIIKFPAPDIVIPGHQAWSDNKSRESTLKLLKNNAEKK